MKKPMKRKVIIGGAVLAVVVVAALVLGGGGEPAVRVSAVPLEQKTIEESLTVKAPLQGVESIEIVSRLHYKVAELNVQEGDVVTAGQVLAVLDSEDLQQDINDARDAYELARAQYDEQLRDVQNTYDKARSELTRAQTAYERNLALYEQGGVSRDQLEQAENSLADAERALSGFTVENGQAVADASEQKRVDMAYQTLMNKQKDLQETQIVSGIGGTVTRVNVRVGRFADDTEDDKPMFVVENIESLQMNASVSEYDIGRVAVGQKAIISADILQGETIEGVVSRISPTGELKGNNSNERVIPVQIDVNGGKGALIAGITAKAKIEIDRTENALVIPIECLLEDENGQYQVIRVEADSTLHLVPVTLGLENDLEVAVISDELKAGDSIVLGPTLELTEGMAAVAEMIQ
ncbi:MAG: efflux RND transporter periplasmic adaptor subunit [Syntrophomonadaceae bacterium]|nr:efflux RND transporter periplasmic adaptor subunit [Syntrophomonadaceae bacterium]